MSFSGYGCFRKSRIVFQLTISVMWPGKIFCGIHRVTKHIPANRIYGIMEYNPQVMFKQNLKSDAWCLIGQSVFSAKMQQEKRTDS